MTSARLSIFNSLSGSNSIERFHKAARDGNLLILKEATKRDLNAADEDGMTAVHWAAYDGRLEALRIITGRGGNPDLPDSLGQTALHYAIRRNHLNCVSFLVNFGCNVWALDDDGHSALDLAGLLGHDHIVRYLDCEFARQYATDNKKAGKCKTRALQDAERRLRKKEQELEKRLANLDIGVQQIIPLKKSNSRISHLRIGGKFENGANTNVDAQSTKSVKERVLETLTLKKTKKDENHGRGGGRSAGKCSTAPTTTTAATAAAVISKRRCLSLAELPRTSSKDVLFGKPVSAIEEKEDGEPICEKAIAKPLGLFDRPGFGSVSFRNLRVVTMFATQSIDVDGTDIGEDSPRTNDHQPQQHYLKNSQMQLQRRQFYRSHQNLQQSLQLLRSQSQEHRHTAGVKEVLTKLGLDEFYSLFQREHISLNSFYLLTEKDLVDLEIPMGPRRIILDAIRNNEVQFDV